MTNTEKVAQLFNQNYDLDLETITNITSCGTTCLFIDGEDVERVYLESLDVENLDEIEELLKKNNIGYTLEKQTLREGYEIIEGMTSEWDIRIDEDKFFNLDDLFNLADNGLTFKEVKTLSVSKQYEILTKCTEREKKSYVLDKVDEMLEEIKIKINLEEVLIKNISVDENGVITLIINIQY